MTHQRNVKGLRASAQRRHEEAVARAEDAIVRLHKQGTPISFPSVAQAAGVSVSWLYQNPEIRQRIQLLRQQQQDNRSAQVETPRAEPGAAKEATITALRQKIKELRAENRELRKQLEIAYGQLYQQQRR